MRFSSFILALCLFAGAIHAALPLYPAFYTVDSNGNLNLFSSQDPSTVISSVEITGLQNANEFIIDIDVRPSTNVLYGVARNTESATGALYTIDSKTGIATLVGPLTGCTLSVYPTYETPRYGIDFDPVLDVLRIVGEDTQNYRADPATGACTVDPTLFFNGPYGRGSTPSRAVAYTNNLLPTTSSTEYILTGVHLTMVNTANYAGCYIIREGVTTHGPFDIYTGTVGTQQINIAFIVTPSFNTTTGLWNYHNVQLQTISLSTGVQEVVGTFSNPGKGVYIYGLAVVPVNYTI